MKVPKSSQMLVHAIYNREMAMKATEYGNHPYVEMADWEYEFLGKPKWFMGRPVQVVQIKLWSKKHTLDQQGKPMDRWEPFEVDRFLG